MKNAVVLETEWIVPIEAPVVHNGWIVIESGRVRYVGEKMPDEFSDAPRVRLEGGAILPGLINSHCHLEFSDLTEPIELLEGGSLIDWLRSVMARRGVANQTSEADRFESRRAAWESGIAESWRSGTRWVVDNVTMPFDRDWVRAAEVACRRSVPECVREILVPESCVRVQPCIELVDVTPSRWEQTWRFCIEQLDAPKFMSLAAVGIAPHAPYTASLAVTRAALDACRARGSLFTMHLAESPEERRWLEDRTGPMAEWIGPYVSPSHLEQLGTVAEHLEFVRRSGQRALVVHGNDLNDAEIARIANGSERMSVVYCPRTHRFFGHAEHPLERLLEASVPVLLGTDSRASNPDLSVWEEWRCACERFPSVTPQFLAMSMTVGASRSLGLEGEVGCLRAGCLAQLTWVGWDEEFRRSDRNWTESELWQGMLEHGSPKPLELHPAIVQALS